jgi:surfeit locus 1 family protein
VRRFPFGLTLAAAIGITILIGLGVWQLQRLKWKEDLLTRVAAARTAPALPLQAVMAQARSGRDVEWRRVRVTCDAHGPTALLYALDKGQVVWRAVSLCAAPLDYLVVVDRGYLDSTRGLLDPPAASLPPPGGVTGVLRKAEPEDSAQPSDVRRFTRRDTALPKALFGAGYAGPIYYLIADHEEPAPPGVSPAPLPVDIPNRHFEYALTWFGLAGALAGVYLAVLWRRRGPQ